MEVDFSDLPEPPRGTKKRKRHTDTTQEGTHRSTTNFLDLTPEEKAEIDELDDAVKRLIKEKDVKRRKDLALAKRETAELTALAKEDKNREKAIRFAEQKKRKYPELNWEDEQEMERARLKKKRREDAEPYNTRDVRSRQKKAVAMEAARRSVSGITKEIDLGPNYLTSSEDEGAKHASGLPVESDKENVRVVKRAEEQAQKPEEKWAKKSKRQRRRARVAQRKREAKEAAATA